MGLCGKHLRAISQAVFMNSSRNTNEKITLLFIYFFIYLFIATFPRDQWRRKRQKGMFSFPAVVQVQSHRGMKSKLT